MRSGWVRSLSQTHTHTHTCRSELQIDLHHFWQWCISELTRWDSISTQLNSFPFNYCLSLIPNVSQIREAYHARENTVRVHEDWRFSWKHPSVLYLLTLCREQLCTGCLQYCWNVCLFSEYLLVIGVCIIYSVLFVFRVFIIFIV